MVTFIKVTNTCQYKAIVKGNIRFIVNERCDYAGGWNLFTVNMLLVDRFETLCDVETYIKEMDK